MKNSTAHSLEVTNQIMEAVVSTFKVEGELNQMKVQIHPIIGNAMFHRDKELLEIERFRTLIALSRALDDQSIEAAIKALRYQLTVKPDID